MKLHEYQSKQIFVAHGVPIPQGEVARTPVDARRIAEALDNVANGVVVKAQVLVGGRGKAGGVRLAATPEEAAKTAADLLEMKIKGLSVRQVLVEEAVSFQQEIYLGIVVDRTACRMVLVASAEGGVEIEEVARNSPEAIRRVVLHPSLGLRSFQTLALANGIGLPAPCRREFDAIARGLYESMLDCDGSLAEINPLVITQAGELLALDGKMVLDDSALFRHPDLLQMRDDSIETVAERQAREAGLSYVGLEGEIGCMVNGAGLAMATMDIVKHFGGTPANFLDIGGGARAERVTAALRLILADRRVKVVLLNIFGGITRCDEVARGVVAALDELEPDIPLIARLVGTNEAEGRAILTASVHHVTAASTLAEAAQKAVAAAG